MKSVLKYILPLFCFVVLMGSSEVVAGSNGTNETTVVVTTDNAGISTDEAECIPIRPTASVNNLFRVSKHSRQNKPCQRRCGVFPKDGRVTHLHLHDNTYLNLYLRPVPFPFTAHRLISLGRLVI